MPAYDPSTVLQRALLLERQQGFLDRAAVGSLSVFAAQQVERAGAGAQPGLVAAADALQGYRTSDRRSREAAVSNALKALLTGTRSVSAAPPGLPEVRAAELEEDAAVLPEIPRPASPPPRLRAVRSPRDLDAPLVNVKGIGQSTAEIFERVGVSTVRDLLHYFPREHYDYADTSSISRMRLGHKMTLVGTIDDVRNNRTRRGIVITTATVSDDTGTVAVRWFNQPFLLKRLPIGAKVAITGEPDTFNGYFTFSPRDYELIEERELTHANRLVPVYPLTKGLYQRSLRTLLHRVLDEYLGAVEDFLPPHLVDGLRLEPLDRAIEQYHFPADLVARARAEQRLAFDELLMIQLGLLRRKRQWQEPRPEAAIPTDGAFLTRFINGLPFALTDAQVRVAGEILDDMRRPCPMSRLLQGDVGAGKTVVAAAALLATVAAGKQAAIMAPTEILAEQHERTLSALLQPYGVECHLLVGSMPKARRRDVYRAVADGSARVVVGTHALVQEGLEFAGLGLAVTDEQHRFGVEQRAALRAKGLFPHILAMTATPIPRTLSMTIYGDLDVSVLDEMPPGRMPAVTTWARTPGEAYGVVRDEVEKGYQAFVICPVIEESAESDMRSVVAEHKDLEQHVFPDYRVGLLHGRMRPAEKEKVLHAFRAGDYRVLVATSVVEVGIDIPNATVMVIRDAHRFGLAQLHQFRGRVGRGRQQSFCVLLSAAEGDDARERLEALTATENGFDLAEEDLRLRGPGEFWGTRQSGLPELKVAKLGDVPTLLLARKAALDLLGRDPDLVQTEHRPLRQQVEHFWSHTADIS